MPVTELQDLYQDLILDHGTMPRNYGCLAGDAIAQAEGFNPLCGDKITVYMRLEAGYLKDIQFEGQGCAISVASASLMTELFQGKSAAEVATLWESFNRLLVSNGAAPVQLGKVVALAGVKAFPARVKCATLAWHTALSALKAATANTENPEKK